MIRINFYLFTYYKYLSLVNFLKYSWSWHFPPCICYIKNSNLFWVFIIYLITFIKCCTTWCLTLTRIITNKTPLRNWGTKKVAKDTPSDLIKKLTLIIQLKMSSSRIRVWIILGEYSAGMHKWCCRLKKLANCSLK